MHLLFESKLVCTSDLLLSSWNLRSKEELNSQKGPNSLGGFQRLWWPRRLAGWLAVDCLVVVGGEGCRDRDPGSKGLTVVTGKAWNRDLAWRGSSGCLLVDW